MATSSTRGGAAAMADKQKGQSSASKKVVWLANLLPERIQARTMIWLARMASVVTLETYKRLLEGIRAFMGEVALEMKKVSWPTRAEVINTTLITIVVVFFFALFLFGADIVLSYFIQGVEWAVKKVVG